MSTALYLSKILNGLLPQNIFRGHAPGHGQFVEQQTEDLSFFARHYHRHFCIIAVKSAVDSLQQNIVDGFNELGNDVIYLDKMPWNEDPGENYWNMPKTQPTFEDYSKSKQNQKAKETAFVIFTGGRVVKYKNSSVSNAFIMGATHEYAEIQSLQVEKADPFPFWIQFRQQQSGIGL